MFYGDSLAFPAFQKSFEYVEEGYGYDSVTKSELLLDRLEGNALKFVSSYSRVGDNFKLIMVQLKSDFGNKTSLNETFILKLTGVSLPKYNYDKLCKFKAQFLKT